MSRLLSLLCLAICVLPAPAQLDGETKVPYRLRIALQVARHPLLTPIFKDHLRDELRGSLQAALGAAAEVEVLDVSAPETLRQYPLLRQVAERGLQQGLDGVREVNEVKTHFVRVDFVDGGYDIQARQHDGSTGMTSPVVRHSRTVDRPFVARAAALLVAKDFGWVGTIEKMEGHNVRIVLKGSQLGVPATQWVQKGDVFALAQLSKVNEGLRSLQALWALLQVTEEPRDGICACLLFNRNPEDLPTGPGVLGYRCLHIGTDEAPLRLRLVEDSTTGRPLGSKQVWISSSGFGGAIDEKLTTHPDGFVPSTKHYRNVAFVQVREASATLAKIPIEILDDRLVVCAVSPNPAAEQAGRLHERRERFMQSLRESLQVQTVVIEELANLVKKSREQALERAQKALKNMQNDIRDRTADLENLRNAINRSPAANRPDLNDGEQGLRNLNTESKSLESFIARLENSIKEEKDPKIAEWNAQVEQARLLEINAEYGKALEAYERVAAEAGDKAKLGDHIEKLRASWAVKNDKHRDARAFIYEKWRKLTGSKEIADNLEQAHAALKTCEEVGDRLSPSMLLRTGIAQVLQLKKELDSLRPDQSQDDRQTSDRIEKLSKDLAELLMKADALAKAGAKPQAEK